jgi:26S proteasome regulatory subunit N2
MLGVVGMLVFTQYWYWFPLSHFLSLAFQPTAIIGLNSNLDMPVAQFKSSAKPSMYGYTPNIEEKKKEDKEKVATAVLSITAKQKKKNAEKGKKDGEEKMDVDTEKKEDKKEKMEVDEKKDEEKKEVEEKKKEPEPLFEMLANPARVMKAQLKVVTLEDARYRPMKDLSIGGIVMLNRTDKGDKDEEIVEPMEVNKASTGSEEEGDEPAPPEPFEWKEEED